ncbi:MAG TPA: M24 family metallopeptidase, partial [Caldisericia bacterium]|nr:M24 family metallopeptidase [Caldisericia bacterium]
GYGDYFGHGLGHGVGLEIHERPTLSPRGAEDLKENMVVTIEPGIYIPNKLGIRIEDLVVVKKNGCLNLTKLDKYIKI